MGRPRILELPWEGSEDPRLPYPTLRTLALTELSHHAITGSYAYNAQRGFSYLAKFFGIDCPASEITYPRLLEYCNARIAAGGKGSLKIELQVLRHAFALLERQGVCRGPPFPRIKARPARKGFFEDHELSAICAYLDADVVPFVRFLWLTGWRREEARNLLWTHVDFDRGTVRLDDSKNGEGRIFPFAVLPPLADLLIEQRRRTDEVQQRRAQAVPWLFWREYSANVRQLGSLTRPWDFARKKAGYPTRILHDFRRTAVRRLEDAGVPRKTAMLLTGHKTEAIYGRYDIRNERDLRRGVEELAKHMAKKTRRGEDPA